jgi:periplasmic divalent cation tolerance protein
VSERTPRAGGCADARGVELVLLTAPDAEVATRLARALVGEGLAACVNLVPGVRSIYRWQGELHDDAEVLLVAKTCADRAEALGARVRELHPYELPELVRLPLSGGSPAYLDWVRGACVP